ncbi:serine hydrolase domain-containing protein [Sphingomonas jatrophae]|uniref:CubicO group peptidase, beta-lactamase class C family n=1 Tax=Sphingomonas jatrophae TaxID=1166337 RepID=A0A1I6K9L3_9SPHN|nr:serine hydrolase [Sphingomonas jatrophae]SFR87922.1 CubicO group peptidase, beta-lactamase class C family [Sphingomonas jatrophae]
MRTLLAACLILLLPAAAQAQVVPQPSPGAYQRAVAAGYKAALYCSGIFNGGRTPAQIDADELAGIYPEYAGIVPTLSAQIDREQHSVSVAFDSRMPPRRAAWTRGQGCVTQPIGSEAAPARLPAPAAGIPDADARPWPQGDAGIAPRPSARLAGTVGGAFGNTYGAGTKTVGLLVVKDGRVLAEQYGAGFGPFVSNRTWSVGKSIAGTLVGLADAGAVGAPATIAEWRVGDPRRRITIDHLLRMASGLHSDTAGNRTDAIYFGGTTVDEQAVAWPLEVSPGTRFRYANNDILLAMYATRQAIGEERYRALPGSLFGPLGMAHTVAETDWHGNYILSSQVWSTARDLARLGLFWLQDGVWAGKRLLPKGWVRAMTTPSGPQPASGPGYGATMWLFGPEQGLPPGSFAAQGNRGQFIMVIPSRRLVIVRRGEDSGAARFDIARFTADVAAALP